MKYYTTTLFFLISITQSFASEIDIESSCMVQTPSGSCTTVLNIANNSNKKSCLWIPPSGSSTLQLISCQGASLLNWSLNWSQTNTSGDIFELRSHDNWPSNNSGGLEASYNESNLLDSKIVTAEYADLSTNGICQVSNSSEYCQTTILVEKLGAKKACLWKVSPIMLLSCQGASINNWNYNWSYTSLTGDEFQIKAHDIWPSQDPQGLNSSFNNALLLNSINVFAQLSNDPPVLDSRVNYRGGTNYHWFYHKYDRSNPNDFPKAPTDAVLDYGIIKNYHKKFDYSSEEVNEIIGMSVRDIVISQLDDMNEGGQERLRIGIWHSRTAGAFHGTTLNSKNKLVQGTNLYIETQYLDNIQQFVTDIKNAGFEEIMFTFYQDGPNRPELWRNWAGSPNFTEAINATFVNDQLITTVTDPNNEPLWIENWRVIKQVITRLELTGIDYTIDLGNEAIPTLNINKQCTQSLNTDYCMCPPTSTIKQCMNLNNNDVIYYQDRWEKMLAKIWGKYVAKYGPENTIGFSIISRNASDFNQRHPTINNVYDNGVLPNTFSLHIYDGVWVGHDDAYGGLNAAFLWKEANNLNTKFIIGETDYNDSITAQNIKLALTGQRELEYILQWPKGRGFYYRIDPPYKYDNYMNEGF